ncbi:MAG: hypothetical protein IPK78_16450 [Rhodospirillales bacterium]|nr:hypothetical protein [Rhodospirillales bacterium]
MKAVVLKPEPNLSMPSAPGEGRTPSLDGRPYELGVIPRIRTAAGGWRLAAGGWRLAAESAPA